MNATRRHAIRRVLLPVLLAALAGCTGMGRGLSLAETAVERHHELYDAERFGIMAANMDAEMKETVTDSQFVAIVRSIHEKMGPTSASKLVGSNVMVTMFGGTRVTLAYETRFQNGVGQEQFLFRVRGGRARLVGWNVSSPVFLAEQPAPG